MSSSSYAKKKQQSVSLNLQILFLCVIIDANPLLNTKIAACVTFDPGMFIVLELFCYFAKIHMQNFSLEHCAKETFFGSS